MGNCSVLIFLFLVGLGLVNAKCPSHWFDCGKGSTPQCVASFFRCDGRSDCSNLMDEVDCDKPQGRVLTDCPVNHFRCNDTTGMCLPQSWRCDGHNDCPDGDDEQECTKKETKCSGYLCPDNRCIHARWVCDGTKDCKDGSDELKCKNATTPCVREHGYFRCKNGDCISHQFVCNGKPDCVSGSDEGDHCEPGSCHSMNCSHHCLTKPEGNECYCSDGYQLDANGRSCSDINECKKEPRGLCSHECSNTIGSFNCSCLPGYVLATDNRTCTATGAEPLMVVSDGKQIRAIWMKTNTYFLVHEAVKQSRGVDVFGSESKIFWVDCNQHHCGVLSVGISGQGMENVVAGGFEDLEDIAVDFIAHNLYLTDPGSKAIVVCRMDGFVCAPLIQAPVIDKVRSIALDPHQGLMYWTDWGKAPGIYRAHMDGSNITHLISENVAWPNGIAYDHTTKRIYWSDAKFDSISVYDTRTKQRWLLIDELHDPRSVTLFEEWIFWADWSTMSISYCNKQTGHNETIFIRDADRHTFGLKLHHPVQQDHYNGNLCWSSPCSHLCLLNGNSSFTCACPPHLRLLSDGSTCVSIDRKTLFLVNNHKSIEQIIPETLGRDMVLDFESPHPSMVIGDFAYDMKSKVIFFVNMEDYSILAFNRTSKTSKTIVKPHHTDSVHGFKFDPHTSNLFWVDANNGLLQVSTSNGKYIATLLNSLERPVDFVLYQERGLIFIAVLGSRPHIAVSNMDGTHHRKLITENIGLPVAMHLCKNNSRLYWADAKKGTIEAMDLTVPDRKGSIWGRRSVLKDNLGHVMSLAVKDDVLYWTDMDSNLLYHTPLESIHHPGSPVKVIPLPDSPGAAASAIKKLLVLWKAPDDSLSPCVTNNGNCSHICLLGGSHGSAVSCRCPVGFQMTRDRATCKMEESCRDDEILCADKKSCILETWKCDGNNDCDDGSDERNCTGCPSSDFHCANGRCIPLSYECDRIDDCGDNSDETNCTVSGTNGACLEGQFDCGNNHCVPGYMRCDLRPDCFNEADETDCAKNECKDNKDGKEFRCGNGQCVPMNWKCDGEADCMDASDEKGCKAANCTLDQFKCNNGICIDMKLVCDHRDDCDDGQDEDGCRKEPGTCPPELHTCKTDGHCIYPKDLCDGHWDCEDGEDEQGCEHHACSQYESYCAPGNSTTKCIPQAWLCDGENDCGDWSDEDRPQCSRHQEMSSTTGKPCRDGTFPCTSGDCLDWSKVCDKNADCLDSSDEGSHCDYACGKNNGGCAQICRGTPLGSSCACKTGYFLSNDGKSCEDIDECAQTGQCSQFCVNEKGSFNCSCADGYTLATDQRRCKASNSLEPMVLYMLPDQVRSIGLIHRAEHLLVELDKVDMEGMDYDLLTNEIFWLESLSGSIHAKVIGWPDKRVIKTGLNHPTHLAWDWIARNFYFVSGDSSIHTCTSNGSQCSKLLDTHLTHISSLMVSPTSGFMFWSIWNEAFVTNNGRIERAEMDGSNRRIIVVHDLNWPSGLTDDRVLKQIYWVDTKRGEINVADYSGGQRRHLLEYSLSHPFSISIFEDNLYWANFGSDTLMRCNKFTGGSRLVIQRGNVKAKVVRIFHDVVQPKHSNPCQDSTCEQLCLLNVDGFACACKYGFRLLADNVTCVLAEGILDESTMTPLAHSKCDYNVCQNGGECVYYTRQDQWTCLCEPGFSGYKCEMNDDDEDEESSSLGWVIGVIVCLCMVALILFVFAYSHQWVDIEQLRNPIRSLRTPAKNLTVSFTKPIRKWRQPASTKKTGLLDDVEDGDDEDNEYSALAKDNSVPVKPMRKKKSFVNPAYGHVMGNTALTTNENDDDEANPLRRWPSSESMVSALSNEDTNENQCLTNVEMEKKEGLTFMFKRL